MKAIIIDIGNIQRQIAQTAYGVMGPAAFSNNYAPLIQSFIDSTVNPHWDDTVYPQYLDHLHPLGLPHQTAQRIIEQLEQLVTIVEHNFKTLGLHRFDVSPISDTDLQITDTGIRCINSDWDEFRHYVQKDIEHGDYLPPRIRRAAGY